MLASRLEPPIAVLAYAGTVGAAFACWLSIAGCRSVSSNDNAPSSRPLEVEARAPLAALPQPIDDAGPKIANRMEGTGSRSGEEPSRLYVVAGIVDVVDKPSARAAILGTVRFGGSLELSAPAPVGSDADCAGGWYAVLPRGFVCAGRGTTKDGFAPAAEVLKEYHLAEHAALPASYGTAVVTPVYLRLPTWEEQLRSEPGLEEHLHKRAALREAQGAARAWGDVSEGRDTDLYPAGSEVPDVLRAGTFAPLSPKPLVPNSPVMGFLGPGSRVAWVAEFDAIGRTWLITPDLVFVPRDKVKRGVVSGFHGTEVPAGKGIAFVGRRPAQRYRRDAENHKFVIERESFAPDTAVLLAEPESASDQKFLESTEPGVFVRADEVIVVNPTPPSRFGLNTDGAADARWVEFNARTQVLVLRDGPRIIYATFASSGGDTRRGKFRITSKHLTLDMRFERPRSAGSRAEVPEVMLLSESPSGIPASALYAGWWVNAWGSPNAGFGIAVSPFDARRLFDASSPALPEGWHSVRADGTWVVVHD